MYDTADNALTLNAELNEKKNIHTYTTQQNPYLLINVSHSKFFKI